MWNIRKKISKGDYDYGLCPEHPKATKNGYVLMHRLVMENELGRMLEDGEEVHHKDRNRKNNHPSNLEVLTMLEHRKVHATGRTMIEFVCPTCKKVFQKEKRQVKKNTKHGPFCSRRCNGLFKA